MATAERIPDIEQDLVDQMFLLRHNPLGFVRYSYPWTEQDLGSSGPRTWQADILAAIGGHLRGPNRFQPCRVAVASGHGVGKSALVGWIIDWGLSTATDCRVIVTANTGDQLATKTVPEVSKWFRLSINNHWWDVRAQSIKVKDAGHRDTWRADFLTWSEERIEGFAGLHNQGKRIIVIMDEASAIPDKVWEVIEGALTDAETEILWFAFGNPTQNTGRFRECFGKQKHRWLTFQIDSRTVEGTNKEQIAKWVEDYGEDSDFVRVRVRGEFPRAGSCQFIPSDVVAACRKYRAAGYDALPKVLSVDVARYGDDQTIIGVRQGRLFRILGKYRGLDTVTVASKVIEAIQDESPDGVVVDGDGIGAGVVDQLQHRGFTKGLFEFHGAPPAIDAAAYYNRRAEIWGLMRDALKAGMQVPDDPELESDLTGPEYGFSNKQQIQLEKKEDMKKRGLSSPDCGDCLAMTFAVKLAPKPKVEPVKPPYYGDHQAQAWMG